MVTSGDTHEQVAELVANLRTAPLGIDERVRVSLGYVLRDCVTLLLWQLRR